MVIPPMLPNAAITWDGKGRTTRETAAGERLQPDGDGERRGDKLDRRPQSGKTMPALEHHAVSAG
jgi:hypothetical protein